ncbi:MAG: sensor histidine kinase [Burkholderiales bacterium]
MSLPAFALAPPAPAQGKRRAIDFTHSLRFRLVLSVALVHVVLMGVFVTDAMREQSDRIQSELYSRGRSLVSLTAVASTNALLTEDLGALAEIIQRVKSQPDVVYCEISDAQGRVLGTTYPEQLGKKVSLLTAQPEQFPLARGDHTLDLQETIKIANQAVGLVTLGLSTERMNSALAKTWREGLFFILAALIVGSGAAWALSLLTTRGLHGMMGAVRKISQGDLDVRVPANSRDEIGMLAIAFNNMVASLKRASEEATQEHERRTQAERLACVGEMSATIAHEIRNPLSAIINSVNLLGGDTLNREERAQVISILNNESRRLNRILGDFLNFAKIRESEPARADLKGLIEEIANILYQDHRQGKSLRLTLDCAPDAQTAIFDHDQMRQVLWNLMLNALQAMPEGGELSVLTRRDEGKIRVSIADTGCGIAPEFLREVTKPFVTSREGGTGLGLAIVQRILAQHDTQLDIISHPGVGTEVSFLLNGGN